MSRGNFLSDELEIQFGALCLSSAKRFVFMVTCDDAINEMSTERTAQIYQHGMARRFVRGSTMSMAGGGGEHVRYECRKSKGLMRDAVQSALTTVREDGPCGLYLRFCLAERRLKQLHPCLLHRGVVCAQGQCFGAVPWEFQAESPVAWKESESVSKPAHEHGCVQQYSSV